MAHTICGVQKHFLRENMLLQLSVLLAHPEMMRKAPHNSCFLVTSMKPTTDLPDTRKRVIASIYLRKGINHHLSRLCIAHEVYHLLLALEAFKASKRDRWAQLDRTKFESECNQFSQKLCEKHHHFHKSGANKHKLEFPEEIFKEDFVLDLSDFENLPECLRETETTSAT